MGTRADFYVGRGLDAEWLGSIAWDGYPGGIDDQILHVEDEGAYRRLVKQFLQDRDSGDGTFPEMGWPWPWENSKTTDYAYAFDMVVNEDGEQADPLVGKVWASSFGHAWFDPTKPEVGEDEPYVYVPPEERPTVFPDMTDRQNVTRGSRSGIMVIGATEDGGVMPLDRHDIDAYEAAQRGES